MKIPFLYKFYTNLIEQVLYNKFYAASWNILRFYLSRSMF